jgi:hypothetical protein
MIQRLDRVLWGLALASAVSGIGLAMSMVPAPDESIWGIPSAPGALAPSGGNAGDIVRSVVSTDPFRLERRPSSVPFGTEPPITPVPERLTCPASSGRLGGPHSPVSPVETPPFWLPPVTHSPDGAWSQSNVIPSSSLHETQPGGCR